MFLESYKYKYQINKIFLIIIHNLLLLDLIV